MWRNEDHRGTAAPLSRPPAFGMPSCCKRHGASSSGLWLIAKFPGLPESFQGSLGTRTSVGSPAPELLQLSLIHTQWHPRRLPATAPELDLNPAEHNEHQVPEISQNSRTGIYNLLVPDKHWITADTPKLARASALPKVHWCFCETVTLQETQCHQEKSSIRFYKVINKGLKKKVMGITAIGYGVFFWGVKGSSKIE